MDSSRASGLDMEATAPEPKDMSHHFSDVTKARYPSVMKQYYKYFLIPGIGQISGGVPYARLFPFDTLEAQVAKPERWQPSLNHPGEDELASKLAATSVSDVASPAHITVPHDATGDLFKKIDIASALQYGQANGYPPLLSFLRQFSREVLHPNVPYKGGPEVICTNGNTDGMSKSLELFTNPWVQGKHDVRERPGLLSEVFMYPSVLSQAQPRGVNVVAVEMDDAGMAVKGPGGLEDVLENWDEATGKRPHLMYTVTMGHNPTSGVLKLERRREIYALCSKYDVIIIEDDPYWYLQFPTSEIEEAKVRNLPIPQSALSEKLPKKSGYDFIDSLEPSFLNIDTDGRVVRLDTFSKTVAPGCRLGWITAAGPVIERFLRLTEASSSQPSGFVQGILGEMLIGPQPQAAAQFASRSAKDKATFSGWQMEGWVRWLAGLRGQYERRMNRMCQILEDGTYQLKQSTPVRDADSDWGVISKTRLYDFAWPRGGMFVWLHMHFETHPLWQVIGTKGMPIDGTMLSAALMILLTRKPFLVLISPGAMFSINDQIRKERGWAYYRLCFAAVTESDVDACSTRLVNGIHRFWRVKKIEELQELLDEADGLNAEETGLMDMGSWMGC